MKQATNRSRNPAARALACVAVAFCLIVGDGRTGEASIETIHVGISSGIHDGPSRAGADPVRVFQTIVDVPDAASWVRVRFLDRRLGARSYVLITSLDDGAHQRLDRTGMTNWRNMSAYLTGSSLRIELFAGAGDRGVYADIDALLVPASRAAATDAAGTQARPMCDDDRVGVSADNRVGRIAWTVDDGINAYYGCTAFRISTGVYVTAGWCCDSEDVGAMEVLEFNVPLSSCNGTIVRAHPDDQYPIDQSSMVWGRTNNVSDNWGIFRVLPNSNHGQLPVERYGGFFRMARATDVDPAMVRVAGFGLDEVPPGCGGGPIDLYETNGDSQTFQEAIGDFGGEVLEGGATRIRYYVHSDRAGDGSPVIAAGTDLAIGLDSGLGCFTSPGLPPAPSEGTGLPNDLFEAALTDFVAPGATFVDRGHGVSVEDGSILRPFDTIAEGVAAAPPGGLVSIMAGTYSGPKVLNGAAILKARMGNVVVE